MATFVVGKGSYIRPHRNVRTRSFPEAASQSFIVGDPLIMNATSDKGNEVKIASADPSGTVIGFAARAASGTAGTEIQVWMLDEQGEFLVHVGDGQTQDNDDITTEYGIVADATNLIWRLDRTETSAKVFRPVDFAPNPVTGARFAHGDVNGAFICTAAANQQGLLKK